ncbi:hypothetical protein [Nocardia yunnanensis]|uniref:hypothetical protein n=1 Tax=Nocardia yunnanensis TaxID=2382165 RepID=UPI0016570F26|nr:hypothetical protein [Nocardia yunnanensis]
MITAAGRTRYQQARDTYDDTLTAALNEIAATDPAIAAILATARETARAATDSTLPR